MKIIAISVAIGFAQVSGAGPLGDGQATEHERVGGASIEAESASSTGAKQRRASGRNQSIEEVIVTAQKREERLQDVPISIAVLGGEQLDSLVVGSARDILRTVPGVTIGLPGLLGDGTSVNIRGVVPQYGSGTVGYYMDGVPFGFVSSGFLPDTNVYDVERIEVLRGPQGTLYGASSLNGVVRVLTHEADLNAFQFKARTSGATTEDGDETYRADGAINVPIVEGKLAARATVSYADVGGWIDNLVKENINSSENLDARLKVRARPTDALSIGLSYWQSRHDTGAASVSDSNDFYPGRLDPTGDIDFDVYGGEIAYEFPSVTVSSTTSYMEYSNATELDWSAFENTFLLTDLITTIFDARVFSEEVLVKSSGESDWRWTLGAFYRDAKDRFSQQCFDGCLVLLGDPEPNNFGDDRYASESYAAFGEVTKLLLDGALELTGGLRYFHDEVTGSNGLVPSYNPSATFEKVSPRAVVTWHANENSTLYASYAQGFRSGLNQQAGTLVLRPDLRPVEPDKLDNYEIGAKGNLGHNLFTYEAAVYYVDWQDTQQNLDVLYGPNNVFSTSAGLNASSASGLGAELSLTLRPADGLSLTGSFGINDVTVDSPIISGSNVIYEKGDRLNGSSKYTAAASASYSFPLGGAGLGGTLSLSGNYMSSFPTRYLVGNNFYIDDVDSFLSVQGSVGIAAADRWSLQLFADNLTNERRRIGGDFLNTEGINFYNRFMRPRTIGLQFEFNY